MRGFRYVLLAITTSSMVFIYCNRVQFGFTLICQRPENSTENPGIFFFPTKIGDFSDYYLNDPLNVAWIFTSAAIGMCVGPLPLYYVYKFDTRCEISFITFKVFNFNTSIRRLLEKSFQDRLFRLQSTSSSIIWLISVG